MYGYDDGEAFWAHVEPGAAGPLVEWLDSMRFMMRVEVADITDSYAVAHGPGELPLSARRRITVDDFAKTPKVAICSRNVTFGRTVPCAGSSARRAARAAWRS